MCGYHKAWYLRYDKDFVGTEATVYVGVFMALYGVLGLPENTSAGYSAITL